MSGFGFARQGCSIKPRSIEFSNTHPFQLRKVSEIGFTGEPQQVAQMPTWLRTHGVQIGIQIPPGHRIVNGTGAPPGTRGTILFGVGTVDGPVPSIASMVPVHENRGLSQFLGGPGGPGQPPDGLFAQTGLWRGFDLPGNLIPRSTAAKPEDERFYTDITFQGFQPKQKLDFHIVPIVFVLRGVGFDHHYILGASVFTSGWQRQGDVDDFWTCIEAVPQALVHVQAAPSTVKPEDPKPEAP